MIARKITPYLLDMANKYPVISLTGPRQAGKSTLLKHIFPDYRYISLEDPDMMDYATDDPKGFLGQYDKRVIFDEVQRVPRLLSYIQTIVDERKLMGQFVLSGSQNFLLLENITQSLAGRVALFNLLPFSFSELSDAHLLTNSPERVMFDGFYPAIFDRQIPPSQYYPNYIETYVERDVRSLINVKDLHNFRKFIRLCAGRTGQLLNISELAVDAGISQTTANNWLSVLEASFITYRLTPYFSNFYKRLIKRPKLYFYDTGLVAYLLGIKEQDQLATHYLRGSLFENLILSDFMKQIFHSGQKPMLYFYRDSNKNEIDCIYETAGQLQLIEIKSGKTISQEFSKGITNFQKMASESVHNSMVIYGGSQKQHRNGINYLPWHEIKALMD